MKNQSPIVETLVAHRADVERAHSPEPRTKSPPARLRIVEGSGAPREPLHIELGAVARHYLRERRRREARLPADLFADPVWDTMLDLFASKAEGRRVTVSDACIAASVPATTALRWFAKMEENGLIVRRQDPHDARRAHVELTEGAAHEVASWLKRTFVDFCRG
jgi:hypothetical protein